MTELASGDIILISKTKLATDLCTRKSLYRYLLQCTTDRVFSSILLVWAGLVVGGGGSGAIVLSNIAQLSEELLDVQTSRERRGC